MENSWKGFICGMIVGVGMALLAQLYAIKPRVYVNVDHISTTLAQSFVKQGLSDVDAKLKSTQYQKKLSQLLDQYAKEHRAEVFSSPKPLRGVKDATDWFVKRLVEDGV